MSNETNTGSLNNILAIRAQSGGERGNKDAGKKFDYTISRGDFLDLVGKVFDKEVENSKPENAKSGGAISQFLHSYGATAEKMEKSGIDPFPAARFNLIDPATQKVVAANVTEAEGDKWLANYGSGVKPVWEPLPGAFNGENVETWLEVMEFKKPRENGMRKTSKEVTMDAILAVLALPGISWDTIKGAYQGIAEADLEAYIAKKSAAQAVG